jgi:hypothetical protein
MINELFDELHLERKRTDIPKSIVSKALKEVDKIKKISYKKKDYGDTLFWGANPYKTDCVDIELPVIELDEIKEVKYDFIGKAIIYDNKQVKKEGLRLQDKSCIITYKGEIQIVYITGEYDEAINKATEKLKDLGEGMEKYYPVKEHTFYTPFKLVKGTKKDRDEAYKFKKDAKSVDRYYGKNWMDGQIKYYLGKHPNERAYGAIIAYQPRSITAYQDKDFMYNFVYSYCALYELEKRYAPAVAKWRLQLAEEAGKVSAIPGVPLSRHPATGMGASLDFASAIHNDSGMDGLSETIFWIKPATGEKQYFVSPTLGLFFDLTKHNCIILQPPKIPHGTINSGNHKGYGFVNITKKNLISKTELNAEWYDKWKKYTTSKQSKKDFGI